MSRAGLLGGRDTGVAGMGVAGTGGCWDIGVAGMGCCGNGGLQGHWGCMDRGLWGCGAAGTGGLQGWGGYGDKGITGTLWHLDHWIRGQGCWGHPPSPCHLSPSSWGFTVFYENEKHEKQQWYGTGGDMGTINTPQDRGIHCLGGAEGDFCVQSLAVTVSPCPTAVGYQTSCKAPAGVPTVPKSPWVSPDALSPQVPVL